MFVVDAQKECLRKEYIGAGGVAAVHLTERGHVFKEYICQLPQYLLQIPAYLIQMPEYLLPLLEYSSQRNSSIDPDRMSKKLDLFDGLKIRDVSMILAKVEIGGVLVGCIAEHVNSKTSLQDALGSKKYTIGRKVGLCLQAETIEKSCHDKGIVIGDMNSSNFLVLKSGKLKMIDFDNAAYGGYRYEKCSQYAYMHLTWNGLSLSPNIDKVAFGLMALDHMTRPEDQLFNVLRARKALKFSRDDVSEHISSLSIPSAVRDEALELISDTTEKRYFGEALSELGKLEGPYLTRKISR